MNEKVEEKIEELKEQSKEEKVNKKSEKKECKDNKKLKELETEIEALKLALNASNEKALRANAEMMNFKRRKEEETAYMLKFASEDVIKALLPVVDNFERAIKLDDNDLSDEVSKFLSGFKMIYTQMIDVLNRNEVKEIVSEGVEFDPTVHQAVLMEHDDNKPSGVILEVLQKGYQYKDKVIRPAMVKVNE
ncbi:MAG: nucleotide exchange factor GrpE [Bacilli bacterium]|nr:nucleotide exchange factor GrpE [Bacilli bacterium]